MASATQFVVVESSHSDAKWFDYYQQLLHHFYWASVWWPPNATVQKHNADGTSSGVSLTTETKVESSLNQVACTEDEQDDYESCSEGGTSEGCSVYSCSSRIINNGTGSKYFHHEFDEHGQDLPDYSCTEIRKVDSQCNSSCLRQRVEKWPSRRRKRSVVGDKADEPLRNSLSNTAPQWEALPQDGQHWSGDSAITSRNGGQLTQCGDECDSQDDFSDIGIELCDRCGAVVQCTVLDDEVICRDCRNTAADDEAADDDESHAEGIGLASCEWNQDPGAEMCRLCELAPATGWWNGMDVCRSCGMHMQKETFSGGARSEPEDEDDGASDCSELSDFSWAPSTPTECTFTGLVAANHLNGKHGLMVRWHGKRRRWEVNVEGKVVLAKPRNVSWMFNPAVGSQSSS